MRTTRTFCVRSRHGSAIPRRLAGALALVAAMLGGMPAGLAQGGRLEARYTASLGGIPLGKGNWTVDINDNRYSATITGGTVGLLKLFASGEGQGSVRGVLSAALPTTASYSSTIKTSKKTDAVQILLTGGVVKDASVSPPVDDDPERVALTDAHRRGVMDPITASLLRVPGNGSPLAQQACRPVSVFDGRTRYDLQLAYKRMDHVKADKGYEGPVVVCSVQFKPIAGFILSRTAIKYLVAQRDMEVWLAPVAGTRVVVPYRVTIPTPVGLAALEADDFVATVQAAAANEKSR